MVEICCQTDATQAVREITQLGPCNCSARDWQCNGGRFRLCPIERETTCLTCPASGLSRVGECRLNAPLLQRLSLAQLRPLKRRTAKMILSSLRTSGVERSCAFPIGSPHQNQRDQRSSSSDQLLKNGNPRRQPLPALETDGVYSPVHVEAVDEPMGGGIHAVVSFLTAMECGQELRQH